MNAERPIIDGEKTRWGTPVSCFSRVFDTTHRDRRYPNSGVFKHAVDPFGFAWRTIL
jgi:hypothetical protein